MEKKFFFLFVVIAIFFSFSSTVFAVTYNLANDWNTSNPNTPWAYMHGNSYLPYQSSIAALGNAPGFAPSPSNGYFLPVFWKGNQVVYVHSRDDGNGQGAQGEAFLRWTAQKSGYIDLSGFIYYGQTGLSRSNDVILKLMTTTLLTDTVSYANHYNEATKLVLSFSNLYVNAGDILSLEIRKSAGYVPGTIATLNMTITEVVPEPATWVALCLGLIALSALFYNRA
ncbi:MAG: PEP-CTERM sorting domain-containing protein [Candidatus Brocadiae bacterium]|nr:PEP-CTERM sorting domain-containing protein [Candidatus Brocadiia bacterium]